MINAYYLYPMVLYFPPLHELLHVLICYCFNVKVYSLELTKVTHDYTSNIYFEFINKVVIDNVTFIIALMCFVIFVCHEIFKNVNRRNINKSLEV